jgi:hypothetical protein
MEEPFGIRITGALIASPEFGVDGYGGRGQITDVQQPRFGQQVMDVLLPF